jgi:hypothetical protein
VRAGRVGLGAAFATSAAMFVSALGGIASIDVNAQTDELQQPPTVQTHQVKFQGQGCPDRSKPVTEQS